MRSEKGRVPVRGPGFLSESPCELRVSSFWTMAIQEVRTKPLQAMKLTSSAASKTPCLDHAFFSGPSCSPWLIRAWLGSPASTRT